MYFFTGAMGGLLYRPDRWVTVVRTDGYTATSPCPGATDADVEEFHMPVVTGDVIFLAQADSLDEVVDKITELCECDIHNAKDSFASGVLEQQGHSALVMMERQAI